MFIFILVFIVCIVVHEIILRMCVCFEKRWLYGGWEIYKSHHMFGPEISEHIINHGTLRTSRNRAAQLGNTEISQA